MFFGESVKLIFDNISEGVEKSMCTKENMLSVLKDKKIEVLITLGAGDIEDYTTDIQNLLKNK